MCSVHADDKVSVGLTNLLREIFNNVLVEEGPRLDPYIMKDERIQVDKKNIRADAQVTGVLIKGASNLKLKELKLNLNNDLSIDINFGIQLPKVLAAGRYKIDGRVAKYVPLRGNGAFNISIMNLDGGLRLSTSFDGFKYRVKDLDINLRSDMITPYFENLIDPNLAPFINSILKMFTQSLVNKFVFENPKTMNAFKAAATKNFNKQLDKFSEKIMEFVRS